MNRKMIIPILAFLILVSFASATCLPLMSPTTNASECCSKRAHVARGNSTGIEGQLVCSTIAQEVGVPLRDALAKMGATAWDSIRSRLFPTEEEKLSREQREAEKEKWAQEQTSLLLYKSIEIKARIGIMWSYVRAIFILTLEVLKLLFYVIELMLFVYVFLVLIPHIFFRVRDKIVENYTGRGAT